MAGIEAISPAGHLSLDELEIEASTLFAVLDSSIAANDETRISISSAKSVSLDGLTPTGIFFSGSAAEFAAADIELLVGLGDAPPVALPKAQVPEPTGNLLGLLGLVGALCMRQRKSGNR